VATKSKKYHHRSLHSVWTFLQHVVATKYTGASRAHVTCRLTVHCTKRFVAATCCGDLSRSLYTLRCVILCLDFRDRSTRADFVLDQSAHLFTFSLSANHNAGN
jgi:hypothetical protein